MERKDGSFQSVISKISKGFGDEDFYPTLEEKAAPLLCKIVKNHGVVDGNTKNRYRGWRLESGTIKLAFMVYLVYYYTITTQKMARQTITVNEPNDRWMKEKIQGDEYASKSELINDLIRRQRELEDERIWLRNELIKGEDSGISTKTMAEILEEAKNRSKDG